MYFYVKKVFVRRLRRLTQIKSTANPKLGMHLPGDAMLASDLQKICVNLRNLRIEKRFNEQCLGT